MPSTLKGQDQEHRRVYPLTKLELEYEDGSREIMTPTPEQIAVAIAKCSRSDTPFDQNILDVSLEQAAAFHDKWVVGYGHGSVAEHAVASVALERISQIGIKILEDSRLASYTEKSSRYVVFTRDRVVLPSVLKRGPMAERVNDFLDRLYRLYDDIQDRVRPLMLQRFPKTDDMPDKAYAATTKARVCDVARYCLPAAAAGNLGMTANARTWGLVITKLASSPHEEARELAIELIEQLRAKAGETPDEAIRTRIFPTLLKYAGFNQYQAELPERMRALGEELLTQELPTQHGPRADRDRPVVITRDDASAELHLATALLARSSRLPMATIMKQLSDRPHDIERVIREAVSERGEHDQLPREFEHVTFQHEIVMDYGAWRDVQRHRMCTQLNQVLGVDLGYIVPDEIIEVGMEQAYRSLMDEAIALHAHLTASNLIHEAEYLVPMAFQRRLIVTWSLRELDHFITLRSGKKGHPSYRRIAQETWRTIQATHPLLAELIRVDLSGNEALVSTLGAKPKGF
ncbi:MAG: FAD-dependent thymidylate synthase [Candidatus Uhrbacteria bacterium]|nr:FAD-dependent thymidylate synthase [Candidatus Uhrbacteria bacterium]